jgi:4-amino-4-deoxy-L-arabinose transferase-like glycosyltransferase
LDVQSRWTIPAIFWTALAAGVLLKGPVILMFVVLGAVTLVVVDRSARWLPTLRPFPGVVWFLLVVLPWFIAITWRSGDRFFAESVGHDLFPKLMQGQESHGAPPEPAPAPSARSWCATGLRHGASVLSSVWTAAFLDCRAPRSAD